jgi:hypothetical protein
MGFRVDREVEHAESGHDLTTLGFNRRGLGVVGSGAAARGAARTGQEDVVR